MSRFATSSLRSRTRQAQLILLPPGTTAESPVGCCQETPLRKPGPHAATKHCFIPQAAVPPPTTEGAGGNAGTGQAPG